MNAFTIRDIENLCGIKAHTLRIWEQRYQLLCPKRKAGNHRIYDSNDLKCLLRIAFLYHHGHKISTLARLNEKEISRLILSLTREGDSTEIFVNQLMEAAMDFDQEMFDRILHNVILHIGFERTITHVAYPFLEKIGLLWLTGNVVPAQEHFASALITKKIHVAINGLADPPPPKGQSPKIVLLYTPRGEYHEIPLLYMRYLMKKNGVFTIYFGKDTSLEELEYYCRQKPVTHLYFHLVTHLLRCEPEEYLKKITRTFPDRHIVVSGWLGGSLQQMPPQVRVLKSLEEMQAFAGEQ
ncbi:MAG TPA: MerR family transcriptional regulator [Puia sp.]|nr:MerR family transcriptional regulator [Puia sp.]